MILRSVKYEGIRIHEKAKSREHEALVPGANWSGFMKLRLIDYRDARFIETCAESCHLSVTDVLGRPSFRPERRPANESSTLVYRTRSGALCPARVECCCRRVACSPQGSRAVPSARPFNFALTTPYWAGGHFAKNRLPS